MMSKWLAPVDIGISVPSTLRSLYYRMRDYRDDPFYSSLSHNGRNGEWVMGFSIPPFQRQHVWTDEQSIAFINSARRNLPLGTYTYNLTADIPEAKRVDENNREYFFGDLWLIDGMQRMTALQRFFNDELRVEGMTWSELDKVTQRLFLSNVHFSGYVTKSTNEMALREMYDAMNFGGTPHLETDRAFTP